MSSSNSNSIKRTNSAIQTPAKGLTRTSSSNFSKPVSTPTSPSTLSRSASTNFPKPSSSSPPTSKPSSSPPASSLSSSPPTSTLAASQTTNSSPSTSPPQTNAVAPSSISKNSGKYDYLMKLIVIGDSGVGKSCLLIRFSDDIFSHSFISTIGIDFKVRTIKVDDKIVKLQLYDTAGQERFRTITSAYYRGSHGILLVYDVTDEHSFSNIRRWISEMPPVAESASKLIIGNKCDLDDRRAVSEEKGQQFAKEYGYGFIEASAKANTNVELAFFTIVKEIKNKMELNSKAAAPQETLDVKTNTSTGNCAC